MLVWLWQSLSAKYLICSRHLSPGTPQYLQIQSEIRKTKCKMQLTLFGNVEHLPCSHSAPLQLLPLSCLPCQAPNPVPTLLLCTHSLFSLWYPTINRFHPLISFGSALICFLSNFASLLQLRKWFSKAQLAIAFEPQLSAADQRN